MTQINLWWKFVHWTGIYSTWSQFLKLPPSSRKKKHNESLRKSNTAASFSLSVNVPPATSEPQLANSKPIIVTSGGGTKCWLTRFADREARSWRTATEPPPASLRLCENSVQHNFPFPWYGELFNRVDWYSHWRRNSVNSHHDKAGQPAYTHVLHPWQSISVMYVRTQLVSSAAIIKTPSINECKRASSTQPQPIKRQQALRPAHNKHWLVAACAPHWGAEVMDELGTTLLFHPKLHQLEIEKVDTLDGALPLCVSFISKLERKWRCHWLKWCWNSSGF